MILNRHLYFFKINILFLRGWCYFGLKPGLLILAGGSSYKESTNSGVTQSLLVVLVLPTL